jgi:hypothetical protein
MDSRSSDQPGQPTEKLHPEVTDFINLCNEMKDVHIAKSHDYGIDDDPHANFNGSRDFGIEPFTGLMLRLNDKVVRVRNFIKKGKLMNESLDDALRDISVYATIGRVMLKRRQHIGPR